MICATNVSRLAGSTISQVLQVCRVFTGIVCCNVVGIAAVSCGVHEQRLRASASTGAV